MRRETKNFHYGKVGIGSKYPVSVQSMTNTNTENINETIAQIKKLEDVGCDIVRVAVPNMKAAKAIKEIKKDIDIPLISDIHFDYKLAIESVKNGVDGLRINPGNIGSKDKVKEVVKVAKDYNIPIRIGVNAGSISNEYLEKYGGVNVDSMVESALSHIRILEAMNFHDIVISLKASDVKLTFNAYDKISKLVGYPLHLGITEAGSIWSGTIKSSVGIGSLLLLGIGDTIRVSLTGDPVDEVKVGKQILRSLNLLNDNIEIISCPTCGRTKIDLIKLVNKAEEKLMGIKKPLKVAIMGCAVNGPGEAKEADIGIAGGKNEGIIFKKGKVIKKVKEEKLLKELISEIEKL
ncbi:MAG: flavodoxin-dependent (E)-4-hydroxy-3-methylbut-2-enyl-diphosphate synthase [Firmicutes bacterium]|nr:flavodoxin-dependent (E)-4-hydroxy-3-methylbut-2-enyl-diphosphate synthase [Bacillota bacterium]